MNGVTLDAGALIGLERGDRRVVLLLARAAERGLLVTVPTTALAQVIRAPARQARLMRLIRQPTTHLVPLDARHAIAIGQMLAETGTADIADAHVVLCARQTNQAVVTSDAADLRALDPGIQLVRLRR